jgi:hypothetical protein
VHLLLPVGKGAGRDHAGEPLEHGQVLAFELAGLAASGATQAGAPDFAIAPCIAASASAGSSVMVTRSRSSAAMVLRSGVSIVFFSASKIGCQ